MIVALDLQGARERAAIAAGLNGWAQAAFIAEIVRGELWRASVSDRGAIAVSAQRFGPRASMTLSALGVAELDVKIVLELLAEIGDVQHIGYGRWAPTPPRFVLVPGTDRALVVGGAPLAQMRQIIGDDVRIGGGMTRWADRDSFAAATEADQTQRWEAWLGWPPELASEWAQHRSSALHAALLPRDERIDGLEIYVPARHGWYAPGAETSGTLLCRAPTSAGPNHRRYFMGLVRPNAGIAECIKEAPVSKSEVARLVHGIDALNGCPRALRVESSAPGRCRFTFPAKLPPAEGRAMRVLAGIEYKPDEQRSPRVFDVAETFTTAVGGLARRLCLRRTQGSRGRDEQAT